MLTYSGKIKSLVVKQRCDVIVFLPPTIYMYMKLK